MVCGLRSTPCFISSLALSWNTIVPTWLDSVSPADSFTGSFDLRPLNTNLDSARLNAGHHFFLLSYLDSVSPTEIKRAKLCKMAHTEKQDILSLPHWHLRVRVLCPLEKGLCAQDLCRPRSFCIVEMENVFKSFVRIVRGFELWEWKPFFLLFELCGVLRQNLLPL